MAWWQYEPDKYRVPDLPDPATERAGTAFMLWGVAVVAFLGSVIVGFFARAWTFALYGIGASLAVMAIAALLLPKDKRRPHQ